MHRKQSSSGWARLAAWLDAPPTRSSSVAFQFNHPPRFAISVLTLTLAWVTRIMSPGWRRRASFTFVSSGLSVGRSLWILRTPWSEHWFWRDWTTAMDSSVGTKVSPQPVDSRPASCSSFDSAASSHQQCRKRDSHRSNEEEEASARWQPVRAPSIWTAGSRWACNCWARTDQGWAFWGLASPRRCGNSPGTGPAVTTC